jgi:3-hydroxyanthranilate 3,4-dioxygenase
MWLCQRMLPHRPQRPANTIGLIVEFPRVVDGKTKDDMLRWYCEKCDALVHEATFRMAHIDEDLHRIMDDFWNGPVGGRTCKRCGEVVERAGEFQLTES